MQQRVISAAGFLDVLPASPQAATEWNAFRLFVVDATPLRAEMAFADLALGLYTAGRSRIRRRMEGRSVAGWSDPGTLNMTPSKVDGTWEAEASSQAVVLLVPDASLSAAIAEHWEADPRRITLVPQFLTRDPVIESVLTRLALEARNGASSDTLYLESACQFLTHHIIHAYSSLSKPSPTYSGGLGHRLNHVVDYIEANLAKPIALRELARHAGLGARHFERAFRQSLGVPPHAYVLRRRVMAARELLLCRPPLTMEQIAERVGFSSASHLAAVFRRQEGYTPTRFRQLHGR